MDNKIKEERNNHKKYKTTSTTTMMMMLMCVCNGNKNKCTHVCMYGTDWTGWRRRCCRYCSHLVDLLQLKHDFNIFIRIHFHYNWTVSLDFRGNIDLIFFSLNQQTVDVGGGCWMRIATPKIERTKWNQGEKKKKDATNRRHSNSAWWSIPCKSFELFEH